MAIPLRDDAPTRRIPWATAGLILANVVVFLFLQPVFFQSGQPDKNSATPLIMSHERLEAERFLYRWGAIPCEAEHHAPLSTLSRGTCGLDPPSTTNVLPRHKSIVLSLITSLFLHGGIAHIAGNMLF